MARVLHVLTNLAYAGAQIGTANVCIGVARLGFDVHVAYSSRGAESHLDVDTLPRRLQDEGLTCYDIPTMLREVRPAHDLLAFRQIRRLIRELRPDIVNTHMSKAGILGRLAARAEKVPCIVHTVHGWSFYSVSSSAVRWSFILLERACARVTQRMVAVSPALIEEGQRHGISAAPYSVARTGVDIHAFSSEIADPVSVRKQINIPTDARVVGTVISLCEAKAPLDFVAAAAIISKKLPDVHFLVVGDGPLRDECVRTVEERQLSDKVHFVGVRWDVPRMLRAMDVFVLTSHWEGLPRVVIEAMSAGIPVVATRVGAVPELVAHESTGLLGTPGDISQLAAHVVRILDDPAFAKRLATRAQDQDLERFGVDAAVRQYAGLYRELLESDLTFSEKALRCS
jgi:glycosyltransferase involved in cell wall biosynthesis